MSAATRAMVTGPARALLARHGGRGGWRARSLTQDAASAVAWADLVSMPSWLQASDDIQADLARRVALIAMAPELAASIDGSWLGAVAERAGEEALDAAMARAAEVGADGMPPVMALDLERHGFAMLHATLPPQLAELVAGPRPSDAVDGALARRLLAMAEADILA